jgi:hypothetical protein
MTPVVKTTKNLVMAVSLLLVSAAATADDPPVSTQVVDSADMMVHEHQKLTDPQPEKLITVQHGKLTEAQSWDQENLKKGDHSCPTAIYIAPNGVLEQCP